MPVSVTSLFTSKYFFVQSKIKDKSISTPSSTLAYANLSRTNTLTASLYSIRKRVHMATLSLFSSAHNNIDFLIWHIVTNLEFR